MDYFCRNVKPFKNEMSQTQKEIVLPYATLRYEEPIVFIDFKGDVELGFPEARELIRSAEQLSGNKPYVVCADARKNVMVTREGKRVASDSREAPLHMGTAIVVTGNMIAAGINFFSGFTQPSYPFRAVTSKEEAVRWLMKLPLTRS